MLTKGHAAGLPDCKAYLPVVSLKGKDNQRGPNPDSW